MIPRAPSPCSHVRYEDCRRGASRMATRRQAHHGRHGLSTERVEQRVLSRRVLELKHDHNGLIRLTRASTTSHSDFFGNSAPSTSSSHPLPILANQRQAYRQRKFSANPEAGTFSARRRARRPDASQALMLRWSNLRDVVATSTTHATPRMFPGW